MDWNDLRFFLAVAREGQILGASRRLKTSQATLNRKISALETALDAKLFTRSPTGSALTEAGCQLLVHAERIEAETLQLRASLNTDTRALTGTLRIGAPDGIGVSFLSARIGDFIKTHPDLRVQLVPLSRSFSLSRREADVAITVGQPERGRLRGRKLTDYGLGLYASETYLSQTGAPKTASDLSHHHMIGYVEDLVYSPRLDFTSELPDEWGAKIEISSALGQLSAVKAGAGIGILHHFMAKSDPGLIRVLPELNIERSYWIVWHETLRNSRRVQAFVDFLVEQVTKERPLFRAP